MVKSGQRMLSALENVDDLQRNEVGICLMQNKKSGYKQRPAKFFIFWFAKILDYMLRNVRVKALHYGHSDSLNL